MLERVSLPARLLAGHISVAAVSVALGIVAGGATLSENAIAVALALLVALSLSAVVGLALARSVSHPLAELRRGLADMAGGQFDSTIDASAQGEFGSLMRDLANTQASLRQMVGAISETAMALAAAANQVTTAADRTGKAVASQIEIADASAAAMEQLTASIGQVSDHAAEAARLAVGASSLSNEGNDVVARAGTEMSSIANRVKHSAALVGTLDRRSNEISAIVKVIKDVADQTNLLALNAAIEAARAGEQGRGFAVVADEVRKLAERTASSTAEIAQMIESIQSETRSVVGTMGESERCVADGVTLADQAAGALTQIRSGAEQTVTAVSAIAQASSEQKTAAEGVAKNVELIARMVEDAAAATRETATGAARVSELAASLETSVRAFRMSR